MVFEMLSERMQKLIKERGFNEATLPQKKAIPKILKNENVLIIAPTGIGKTEAAMIPIFDMLVADRERKYKPISVLYINPLRSLSRDLLDRLFWWADKLDLEISVRHGDTSKKERAEQREMPSDILITTPETLGAIIVGKKMREHLKNVKYVVIDEIHELAGNKRGMQLSVLLERLANIAEFQRIGLSATIGNARKIADFLGRNVRVVNAEALKKFEISVMMPEISKGIKEKAENMFIGENTTARLLKINELIDKNNSVLVFTNTRQTAEILSSRFRSIDGSANLDVHHGSLSKESRIRAEKMFKDEKIKALICTSSLELGIDIGSIDLVIQYLSPRQVNKLIQRVGRSGHSFEKVSRGIILTEGEDAFESAVIARMAADKRLEEIKMHEMAVDILGAQIAGLSLEEYGISSDIIYDTIRRAYPYRKLSREGFLEILRFLGSLGILWLNPVKSVTNDASKLCAEPVERYEVRRRKRSWEYYYENLSTIPDTRRVRVVSIIEGEPIGFLDEAFVAEHGEPGKTFVVNGRAWKVVQLEENKLIVEPIDDVESAIPSWEGELIPVPYDVAQNVGMLRRLIIRGKDIEKKIAEEYNTDDACARSMSDVIRKHAKKHTVPDDKTMLIESYKDFVILHTCSGTNINNTIGKYIGTEIMNKTGIAVNMKTDPYRIILQTVSKPEDIKSVVVNADDIKNVIDESMERSSLFKWRFLHVAKRFGIISRNAKFDKTSISRVISQYRNTPAYDETLREIYTDKLDIEGAEKVIRKIRNGDIEIVTEKGLSVLGENGLVQQFSEVIKPRRPEKEIYEAYKRRLMHTRVRLVCTRCADYSIIKEVKDCDEKIVCPKCDSGLIGVYSRFKKEPLKVLKKNKAGKKLTIEETKELKNIKRCADLVLTYGKKFIMTIAGRGIGVETGARILARMPKDEEHLLKYIYEAEKQFTKNIIYWK